MRAAILYLSCVDLIVSFYIASNVAETLAFVQSLFPALRVTEQWVDRLNVEIPIDPEAPILLSQVFGEVWKAPDNK